MFATLRGPRQDMASYPRPTHTAVSDSRRTFRRTRGKYLAHQYTMPPITKHAFLEAQNFLPVKNWTFNRWCRKEKKHSRRFGDMAY